MTETPKIPMPEPVVAPAPPSRSPEQVAKAARLAAALRDNLRRRKVGTRAPVKPGN